MKRFLLFILCPIAALLLIAGVCAIVRPDVLSNAIGFIRDPQTRKHWIAEWPTLLVMLAASLVLVVVLVRRRGDNRGFPVSKGT